MFWSLPSRDDYGRKGQALIADSGRTLGVVVTLPKASLKVNGWSHLANDWTKRGIGAVTYHTSLKAAKAALEAAQQQSK